jgi:hypothetical protein
MAPSIARQGKRGIQWDRNRSGRGIVGTYLFLSSYAPLALIFAVRSDAAISWISWLVVGLVGMLLVISIIYGGRRRSPIEVLIGSVEDLGGEVGGYLATYLLPFISGPPHGLHESLAYAIYFAVAWAVFVRSRLILVNPVLYVLGWRLVKIGLVGGREFVLVCRSAPAIDSPLLVSSLMGRAGYVEARRSEAVKGEQ